MSECAHSWELIPGACSAGDMWRCACGAVCATSEARSRVGIELQIAETLRNVRQCERLFGGEGSEGYLRALVQEAARQESGRFFLDQDNSSHWYMVPVARSSEWSAWLRLDEADEDSWEAPEWAQRIGGSPTRITFTDPQDQTHGH